MNLVSIIILVVVLMIVWAILRFILRLAGNILWLIIVVIGLIGLALIFFRVF